MMTGIILIIIISLLLLYLIWFMICDLKTTEQRVQIIRNAYRDDKNCILKIKTFDKVSRHKHFWYLITFRDPYKLYDPIVFERNKE